MIQSTLVRKNANYSVRRNIRNASLIPYKPILRLRLSINKLPFTFPKNRQNQNTTDWRVGLKMYTIPTRLLQKFPTRHGHFLSKFSNKFFYRR